MEIAAKRGCYALIEAPGPIITRNTDVMRADASLCTPFPTIRSLGFAPFRKSIKGITRLAFALLAQDFTIENLFPSRQRGWKMRLVVVAEVSHPDTATQQL